MDELIVVGLGFRAEEEKEKSGRFTRPR